MELSADHPMTGHITEEGGQVVIGDDCPTCEAPSILRMTPDQARELAAELQVQADRVEGNAP